MPNACWRKSRSPYAPSFDARGRPCELVGTVQRLEAFVIFSLLFLVLVGLALGWVIRYSRKAARFRAFWNQPAPNQATHHRLPSTLSLSPPESHELQQPGMPALPYVDRGPYGRRAPSSSRSSGTSVESLSLASNAGGGTKEPKYAVPRSTSRPLSTMALDNGLSPGGPGGGLGSRKSSYGSLTGASSPLASSSASISNGNGGGGGRPPLGPSRMSSSVLSAGHHGRSPLSSEVDERGVFVASAHGVGEEGRPRPVEPSYGSGGLDSPPFREYHPSSPGPTIFPYPSSAYPPYRPPPPNASIEPASISPLERLAFSPASPPHPRGASASAYGSPPASPGRGVRGPNFSRPTSRASGLGGSEGAGGRQA